MSKQFAEFRVGDVFEVVTGSMVKNLKEGTIPRINPTEQNNGIGSWIEDNNPLARYFEDFVSVSFLGNVFYQGQRSSLEMKVHGLKRKDGVFGHRKGTYVATSVSKAISGVYNYGMQLSSEKLKGVTITLPVTDESAGTDSPEPDWEYMETYIKEIEEKYLDSVVKYNKRNGEILDTLYPDYNGSAPEAYDYAEFRVGDVFEIGSGTNIPQAHMGKTGTYPVIAGITENNGIRGYVNTAKDTLKSALTITCRGRSGVTFWHPYEFVLGNNALSIQRKKDSFTSHQALYVGTALSKLGYGGSYSEYVTYTSLSKDEITLPITPTGEPDWGYMENYIKRIEEQERENRALRAAQEEHILKQLASRM